jgi:hypothetical protein
VPQSGLQSDFVQEMPQNLLLLMHRRLVKEVSLKKLTCRDAICPYDQSPIAETDILKTGEDVLWHEQ